MRMHVKQRFLSLGDKYDIYDESDRPLFQVQGQVFSFGAKISVMNLAGQELFFIQQKVFRVLAEYHVYRGNDVCAVVKQRLSFLKPRLDVSSAYGDFEIEGDFMALDFAIRCNGAEVARVSKKFFSFTDRYGVEVYGNADPAFIATLVVAIDNCLHNGSSE